MKKICAVFLSVCIVLTMFGAVSGNAQAVSFTDVKQRHWAYAYITYLSEKNVLSGDGNGKFRPDDPVKRCEFIKMIDAVFGLEDSADVNFTKMPDWAAPYIKAAAAQGYLLNYKPDVNFDAKLSREEAVALLMRYLQFTASASADAKSIKDYSKITDAYKGYVLAAVENKIISGYPDGSFKPSNTLTRAEALTVLYQAAGAIYSVSTGTAETGCADKNAVVNANASLIGLALNGNVYVTEGASLVAFNNCSINGTLYIRGKSTVTLFNTKADRVVVMGNSSVSLSSDSRAARVDARAKTALNISEDSSVTTFLAYKGGEDSTIAGKGSLTNFGVYVNGVNSSIVPDEYYVAEGCTATIDGREYNAGSGKPVSTGFVSAEVCSSDFDGNTVSIRFTPQSNGKVYAAVWFRSDPSPDAAAIAEHYAAYCDAVSGRDTELRISVPFYGFEYNTALLFVGEDGAAAPLFNKGMISRSYTGMTTTAPAPQSVSAPSWNMQFCAGAIVLSFDQAMYIHGADGSAAAMISNDTEFFALTKSDSDEKHVFTYRDLVTDISTENGRLTVTLYPTEGVVADCEYTVTLTKQLCNVKGQVLADSSRSLLAKKSDEASVVPVISPEKPYVSNGGSVSIMLPESAAALRYSYTINDGASSLMTTINGHASLSIDGLGVNSVINITAEAVSRSGKSVGKSASMKYIVNVAPVVAIAGLEHAGKDLRAEVRSGSVVSVNAPAALKGGDYRTELYFNDILMSGSTAALSGAGNLRAVLYDGSRVIGETTIYVAIA